MLSCPIYPIYPSQQNVLKTNKHSFRGSNSAKVFVNLKYSSTFIIVLCCKLSVANFCSKYLLLHALFIFYKLFFFFQPRLNIYFSSSFKLKIPLNILILQSMAFLFDDIRVILEGLLSFTNTIGHRSTGVALSTWRGREREIGESEMNNLKRNQETHVIKVTFYFS